MAQILFFGASSVYGVGGEKGGAADLIKTELHTQAYSQGGPGEGSGHEIYNLGVPGAASTLLLERILVELKARTRTNRNMVVLVTSGSNDAKDLDSQSSHQTDIAAFKQNFEKVFTLFAQSKATVIAFGLTPIDETKTMPIINPASGAESYFVNNRIKEFEKMFIQVAEAAGAKTIPLFEQAVQESWNRFFLYSDGLHPNSAGHQWIADKIKPHLWPLLNLK